MPRFVKKFDKNALPNQQTFISEVANKSLTTEHCEFFLKKYGSGKVFEQYISKYYPQNGGCSFHLDSKHKALRLPTIRDETRSKGKQNRLKESYSTYQTESRLKICQQISTRKEKVNKREFYGLKLREIIRKIKTEHNQLQ